MGQFKHVVGVISLSNVGKVPKRAGCSTTGNKVVTTAGTLTRRITEGRIAIGTMTPKFVHASVAGNVSRGR